jgi:hypothetical protein
MNDILTSSKTMDESTILVYPNPAFESVTISGLNGVNSHVQLFNIAGEKVGEYPCLGVNQLQINIQHLPKGIYVLKYGNQSFKVVKK